MHRWERVDRVQEYRGCTIKSVTYHMEYINPFKVVNHREYQITFPDGHTGYFPMNRRDGTIAGLKHWIDLKFRTNA